MIMGLNSVLAGEFDYLGFGKKAKGFIASLKVGGLRFIGR